jgi:glycosyltransferase involved in cell wall biosynthesis
MLLDHVRRRISPGRHVDHSVSDHAARNERDAGSASQSVPSLRIMFMYWGRRGLSRFVRDLADAIVADPNGGATLSLSRQNEEVKPFGQLGPRLFLVDTFAASHGAITQAWRVPLLCRDLVAQLKKDRTDAVIDLMPHVWSPFIVSAIHGAGVRYICVVHDADGHPGDQSAVVTPFLRRAEYQADHVLTLSHAVGKRLLACGRLRPNRLSALFHPDLHFAARHSQRQSPAAGTPLRLLFLGRIMTYKGLTLFLDSVDRLRAEGVAVSPGVFGEGRVATHARRMAKMGVELINRRLSDEEVGDVLLRYDALIASHVEASQSGIVAAALGAGLPCVVTPVGGLVEQVADGETGIVADEPTASALSAAVRRLFFSPNLYSTICRTIALRRDQRSMNRFLAECVRVAAGATGRRQRAASC